MPESEARLRAVLESLSEGVAAVGVHGEPLFVNDAMANLLGFANPSELPNISLQETLDLIEAFAEDGSPLPFEQRPVIRALRGERVIDQPLRMRQRAQHREYDVLTSAIPVFGADGKVVMAVVRMRDVTEQKRTMLALKRSEDRYQLASRAVEAMIYDWDIPSGRVERSGALEQILGFQPQEAEPSVTWWRSRVHPDDVSPARSQVESQLGRGLERHTAEYRIRHRDGHWVHVADRGLAIFGTDGEPLRVVGSTVDVTAQKLAQQALRESEKRFSTAFQLAPIAMTISTLQEGRYLDVNEALLEITGYDRNEVIGHTARELAVYPDPGDFKRIRQLLAQDQSIRGLDLQLRGKKGDVRAALLSGDIIELEGEPCLLTASIDITERKASEAALAESEARYRALVENANDIVATLDLDLRFTSINSAVERILGYTAKEIVGNNLTSFVSADQLQQHRAKLRRQLAGKGAIRHEMQLLAKDRRSVYTLEVSSKLLHDDRGKRTGIHVIARDITERKNAEARQALLIRELQHRTKNILAVMQSITNNTLRQSADLESARESLLGRLHALAHAQEFVAAGPAGGVRLRDLIEAELSTFTARASLEGEAIVVGSAFAQTFALVLHELATNALKYGALSSPRGSVAIRWAVDGTAGQARLHFSWAEQDGPQVTKPEKSGFGTQIIGLIGPPRISFGPHGFSYGIDVALEEVMR